MKKLAVVFGFVLMLATPAFAGGCYTAREVEAEQAIRIHSELMVIGLTCIKMPGGMAMSVRMSAYRRRVVSGTQVMASSYRMR